MFNEVKEKILQRRLEKLEDDEFFPLTSLYWVVRKNRLILVYKNEDTFYNYKTREEVVPENPKPFCTYKLLGGDSGASNYKFNSIALACDGVRFRVHPRGYAKDDVMFAKNFDESVETTGIYSGDNFVIFPKNKGQTTKDSYKIASSVLDKTVKIANQELRYYRNKIKSEKKQKEQSL